MREWEWQKSKQNEDERYNGYIFLLSCFLLSFLIKIAFPIIFTEKNEVSSVNLVEELYKYIQCSINQNT